MIKPITFEIDGRTVEVEEGTTVLQAAELCEIKIPTLCHHKALSPYGSCRLCLVEVRQGERPASIQASCSYPVLPGLVVRTDTDQIRKLRKMMLELFLARCPESPRIQELAAELGVAKSRIELESKDCIMCGLCVRMCHERMGRAAIDFFGRGAEREVQSPLGEPTELCQSCGACDFICPTGKRILSTASQRLAKPIIDEFNLGLNNRPPIFIPFPQAVPNVATIDSRYCVHLQTGACQVCAEFCEANAIEFEQEEETITLKAGAIVLSPGVKTFDPNLKKEYGYNRYENVISSVQFERLLSSSGPTGGEVKRPSDGKHPERIAFIQCTGSRDQSCHNEFCSSVCCMYSIKQAVIAREHDAKIKPTIFYIDIRCFGKDFERYYESAKEEHDVSFVRCMISKIFQQPKSGDLMVKYLDEHGKRKEAEFDLVVLAVGLTDTKGLQPLVEKTGIETTQHGFAKTRSYYPGNTSREGVFVAGTLAEPKDIPETVIDGSSAACLASALLKDARGSLIKVKEYPPERNIAEEARVGVFVCRCGRNIGSVVNVPEVVQYAATLDNVVHATEFLYSCSKDALDFIKEDIEKHNINRVVVASCTPRTHEELFRDTIREAGLNKYLFEMVSLREHVSWVHRSYPEKATQKSKDLIRMNVAKVILSRRLDSEQSEVIQKALVLGGGAAGLQASLKLTDQGFEVYLVEQEAELGGHARHLHYSLDGEDPHRFLAGLIETVQSNQNIHLMTESKLVNLSGFMGNYTSIINSGGESREINHGAVIVATGAEAYEPENGEYGFGRSPNILSQTALEELVAQSPDEFSRPKTFVMIQCVGSRNDEHPYCSRVCCTQAVKNALKLKELNSDHTVIVLYRDVRTYGFLETYYLKARESGVIFSRFDQDLKPEVITDNGALRIEHTDALLNEILIFEPDYCVLSTGIIPRDNDVLSKVLKTPLTVDGFFMESHAKIKPLDFTTEGLFLCGLAHSPRRLSESLTQAQGAAVRAATILSKEKLEAKAIIASVNERVCRGCGICEVACPYEARNIDEETRIAEVIDVLCQGCGACAVACPSGATIHKGFDKNQIISMLEKAD